MRLQVGGIDHDPLGLGTLTGQGHKDPVEHTQPAPAHEPLVERLVRPEELYGPAEDAARSAPFEARSAETDHPFKASSNGGSESRLNSN